MIVSDFDLKIQQLENAHRVQNLNAQLYFPRTWDRAMDRLREKMHFQNITVIDPDYLFVDPTSNVRSHLAKLLYKEEDEEIVSGGEKSLEFGPDYISPRSQLGYEANRRTEKSEFSIGERETWSLLHLY